MEFGEMALYVVQSIFRSTPSDDLKLGSYAWPIHANTDEAARARADQLLGDVTAPSSANWWDTGNAARILKDGTEISWRSFDPASKYAAWS